MEDLDFLDTLIQAQAANPRNAAIFNMALERAGGLMNDPKKAQQDQLVQALTNAQIGRFAETGDTDALNMISTLFDAEDPLAALKEYQPSGNAGLMKDVQKRFDTDIQPYIKEAVNYGDTDTASKLSEFTPEALRKLKEKNQEIDDSAKDISEFENIQKGTGDLAARLNFATRAINPFYGQSAAPTGEQKSKALREKVKSVYDEMSSK
jgi:hypothetical protein